MVAVGKEMLVSQAGWSGVLGLSRPSMAQDAVGTHCQKEQAAGNPPVVQLKSCRVCGA